MNLKMLVVLALSLPLISEAEGRQLLHGHRTIPVAQMVPVERLSPTNQLHLAIGLPLRNREGLTNVLQELYNPASVNYRHFLTPDQFTERFGPTTADYQAAGAFARANGLRVMGTHSNRMLLDVQGEVSDIEKAFHIRMHVYRHPTEARTFYAPDAEPSVDLTSPLLHISGLNNYTKPHPMSHRLQPADLTITATPRLGSGPSGTFMGLDFRRAYAPGVTLTGAGQAIGLFEFDGFYSSDIAAYVQNAGMTNVLLQTVLIDGFSGVPTSLRTGSDNEEVALDIEMAISMAPGLSKVLVYEASPTVSAAGIDDLLNRMATDDLAKQLSCSWGFDIDATSQQIFQQFAAQGQSFLLASGDSGAFSGPVLQPSDNPYVTVVGGTSLMTDTSGSWISETTWNGSSGGISTVYPIPDWQQGIDMSANGGSSAMRNLPDVAMAANNVYCYADRGQSFPVSGTSIAAPLWAGFIAMVNEQAAAQGKPPVGFLNPTLYQLGKGAGYATAFHDVATGDNTTGNSPNLFHAVPGYDLCTGWGTPAGKNLIDALLAGTTQDLLISPPFGFSANGPIGGPFNVTSTTYSISNAGATPLDWSIANAPPWLDVSLKSGTLTPGGPVMTVTVGLNSLASNYLIGTYSATLWFTNLNDGSAQSRQFNLLTGNGGFESGDFTGWSLFGNTNNNFADSIDTSQFYGSSTITGVDDSNFVHTGLYGAFLGENGSLGTLSRTLPTLPGQRYVLSFWMANPAVGTPNEFSALWNGSVLFDGVDMDLYPWTRFHYVVAATDAQSTLEFDFRNDLNGFALDDIVVEPLLAPVLQNVAMNNGSINFSWNSVPGIQYQLQYSTNLNSTAWLPLGGTLSATNDTLTISVNPTHDAQRFYRALIAP